MLIDKDITKRPQNDIAINFIYSTDHFVFHNARVSINRTYRIAADVI